MSLMTMRGALVACAFLAACGDSGTGPQGGDSPSPGGGTPSDGGNGAGVSNGGAGGDGGVGGNGEGGELVLGGLGPEGGSPNIDGDGSPPEPPINAPAGDGSAPRIFAVDHLFTGVATFQGIEDANAWSGFGYDIDQQVTGSDFSAHCTPAGGAAPSNVFPDGVDGIDNSFGRTIVPILKTAAATQGELEDMVNEPIVSGDFTLVFDLSSLGAGVDYAPLASSYLEGRDEAATTWLRAPESFTGSVPKLAFPDAYVSGNVWVSQRVDGTLPVKLSLAGVPLLLTIHEPLITAELTADHNGATRGIISGVLATEEFLASAEYTLGALEPSFCDGAAIQGILNQLAQASDIMSDGNQNPSVSCDGISIGLGFTATAVSLGALSAPEPPLVDPCE